MHRDIRLWERKRGHCEKKQFRDFFISGKGSGIEVPRNREESNANQVFPSRLPPAGYSPAAMRILKHVRQDFIINKMNKSPAGINSKPHYEILDGLRGVAAIMVVAFHLLEAHAANAFTQIINQAAA